MDSFGMALIVFTFCSAGILVGIFLHRILPEHHLDTPSKDVVKLGMGLIGTMTALVLGLLTASAKNFFDTQESEMIQVSAKIVLLDRGLANYGSDAQEIRDDLKMSVAYTINQIWPPGGASSSASTPPSGGEPLYVKIQNLSPRNDIQRSTQAQLLNLAKDIAENRWLMFQQRGISVSKPFLGMVIFWLVILFISFSIYAPPNATVFTALILAAASVSGAIFLILELYRPFGGLIQVSSVPLHTALNILNK